MSFFSFFVCLALPFHDPFAYFSSVLSLPLFSKNFTSLLACITSGGLGCQGRRDPRQEPGCVRQLLVLLHNGVHGGGALHQVRQAGGVERAGACLVPLRLRSCCAPAQSSLSYSCAVARSVCFVVLRRVSPPEGVQTSSVLWRYGLRRCVVVLSCMGVAERDFWRALCERCNYVWSHLTKRSTRTPLIFFFCPLFLRFFFVRSCRKFTCVRAVGERPFFFRLWFDSSSDGVSADVHELKRNRP